MSLLGGVGEQLNFLIDLNADSAVREAKRFGDTVERETKRSEDSMSRFSRNAAQFGVGAVAFGGAVLAGLGKAVAAYSEADTQHRKLTTAVANSDQVYSRHGAAIEDAAQSLQGYTTVEGDAAEAAAGMLVQFGLTEAQVKDLLPLVGDLSRRLGVDMEQAAKIVGRAASGEGAGGLGRLGVVLDETSYKADAFGSTMQGLKGTVGGFAAEEATTAAGKIEMLKNNLGDIVEGVGAGAAGVLGAVVGPLADIAQQGGAAGDVLEKIGQGGAILGAGSVLIGGLALAAGSVAKLKANLTDAEGGLNNFGRAAKVIGWAGVAAAIYQVADALNEASKDRPGLETAANKLSKGGDLKQLAQDFQTVAVGTRDLGDSLNVFARSSALVTMPGRFKDSTGAMQNMVLEMDDLRDGLEAVKGDPEALAHALDVLRASSGQGKGTQKELNDEIDKYQALLDSSKAKTSDLADTTDDAGGAGRELTDALGKTSGALGLYELAAADAASASKGYKDAAEALDTDEQVTSALNLGDALHGVSATVKDLPSSFDELKAATGGYTEEQSKAVKAVTDWGGAAKDQISTMIESGASHDMVTAKADVYRESLVKVMRQAGFTDDQINTYLDTLGLTPTDVETAVKLSGDAEARYRLGLLQGQIETLPKDVQTKVTQQILVGDYQGALATVNGYYASHPATLPVKAQFSGWTTGGRGSGFVGPDGQPISMVAPTANGVAAPTATAAAAPMAVAAPTTIINLTAPVGTSVATTLANIRRFARVGGDMGSLLDEAAAIR